MPSTLNRRPSTANKAKCSTKMSWPILPTSRAKAKIQTVEEKSVFQRATSEIRLFRHLPQGARRTMENVFIDMGYIPENAYANVDFYRWLYTSFTRATKKIFLINPPLASD